MLIDVLLIRKKTGIYLTKMNKKTNVLCGDGGKESKSTIL